MDRRAIGHSYLGVTPWYDCPARSSETFTKETDVGTKYRKKPVVIDAERWRGYDHPRIKSWDDPQDTRKDCDHCDFPMRNHGIVEGLEGCMAICPGDWLIRGIKGEYYPCKPDIFEATYEKVD